MTCKNWLLLSLLLLITACSTQPHAIDPAPAPAQPATQHIFIIQHGWHTSFIVPADGMLTLVPALTQYFPDAPYLELGWGDRRFYQSQGFSNSLAARAILWPTDTAMHVVAVSANVRSQFPYSPLRELCLSPQQLQDLLQFLANSFADNETLRPLGRGLYGNSVFFPGAGTYHAFNTCNQWTARGLQSAGLKIIPAFHLRASGILRHLDQQQHLQECARPDVP